MQLTGADPKTSAALFDSLLRYFPHYLDRTVVFQNSLGSYIKVGDSSSARSVIDSLIRRAPSSNSYRHIARTLSWFKYDLPFASVCAESAIARYSDVPENYRDSYLFADYDVLARVHLASGDDPKAERALEAALSIHRRLPNWDRFVIYNVEVELLKKLASIKARNREFLTAIDLCKRGLAKEPNDAELWSLIQYAYTVMHSSGEGFASFRDQLSRAMGIENQRLRVPDSLVGVTFPDFVLSTPDAKKLRFTDFRGKVFVLNFWSFWCGYCLEERSDLEKLFQRFKDRQFSMLAIHGRIGLFGRPEHDLNAIAKSLNDYPTSFPTVIESESSALAATLGVRAIPTTFVVDKKGLIRYSEIGYDKGSTFKRLSSEVTKLLTEQ
jgi:thiol-disulfide isomerase/thioredoxin